jgi:hypothetical protein
MWTFDPIHMCSTGEIPLQLVSLVQVTLFFHSSTATTAATELNSFKE